MADDKAGFRAVLHEWARRQLEERSPHEGPFEVVDVRMDYDRGFGGSDVTPADDSITDVYIRFRHDGQECPRSQWAWNADRCRDTQWSPMDSETTVSMLNHLLAVADES